MRTLPPPDDICFYHDESGEHTCKHLVMGDRGYEWFCELNRTNKKKDSQNHLRKVLLKNKYSLFLNGKLTRNLAVPLRTELCKNG